MTHSDQQPLRAEDALRVVTICETDAPFAQALQADRLALAVITEIDGPSYRPLGAIMAIDGAGRAFGNLSSGCIERDVILHAQAALSDGQTRRLRYGAGSPFRDLTLPCGGGLGITVLPEPDRDALRDAARELAARRPVSLTLGPVLLNIQPALRFLVFGSGPEAMCFSDLTAAAGYQVQSFSPDADIALRTNGRHISAPRWPEDLEADPRCAIALFFHDHDWEPPLLKAALESPALYVGAQGSLRAHQKRCRALLDLGVDQARIDRLASPFGLIPSARDPRTLAASVLAQVLDRARLP